MRYNFFSGWRAELKLWQADCPEEAIHELGHSLSLPHGEDYECVMSPSHGVEGSDLKGWHSCEPCRSVINQQGKTKAVI
jgi:predicted Zn-dependent protease